MIMIEIQLNVTEHCHRERLIRRNKPQLLIEIYLGIVDQLNEVALRHKKVDCRRAKLQAQAMIDVSAYAVGAEDREILVSDPRPVISVNEFIYNFCGPVLPPCI